MVTSLNVQSKLPADERRAVTVEAVIALAGSQNPSDITTAAIAKHMNLTQGALFRHFPSKDSIWQSVMEWVADRLLARIDSAAEGTSSPLSAMQAMFMSHIDFVVEHPGVPRMMFGQLQSTEETAAKKMAQTLIQRYSERVRARIEEGKADRGNHVRGGYPGCRHAVRRNHSGPGDAVLAVGGSSSHARRCAWCLCNLSTRHEERPMKNFISLHGRTIALASVLFYWRACSVTLR
jgi:AcrR family transcriptional regulator